VDLERLLSIYNADLKRGIYFFSLDWGTLQVSKKSLKSTAYISDLDKFLVFCKQFELEHVIKKVKAELAIPVLDLQPKELKRGKVEVRTLDGKALVYFDESLGYTELEIRGDHNPSMQIAKLLVYPSTAQIEELRGIRYEIQELRQYLGSITNSQILAQLAYHVSQLSQRINDMEKAKKKVREQRKPRVRYEDLPEDVRNRIDVLVERGVAYCSQYRLYPTKKFLQKIREGKLPEILAAAPEDLEDIIKLLARRPAGIPFSEFTIGDFQ